MSLWIGLIILGGALVLLIFNHDSGTLGGVDLDNFAAISRYSAIGVLVAAAIIAAYRKRLREGLFHALIWIMFGITLVAAYGMRHDFVRLGNQFLAVLIPGYPASRQTAEGIEVVTLRRRADGHFVASAEIDGTSVTMLVDTGASTILLRAEDAIKAGIFLTDRDYSARITTANGTTLAAPVRLNSIAVGNIRYENVKALVARPNSLQESLLGNSFLERLGSYKVEGDSLVLRGAS